MISSATNPLPPVTSAVSIMKNAPTKWTVALQIRRSFTNDLAFSGLGLTAIKKCEEPTEFRGHDTTSIECDTNRPPRREAQIPPLNAAPSPTAVVILIVIGSTTPKLHFEPRSRDHPCAYKVPDIEVAGQVWSDTARGMTVF